MSQVSIIVTNVEKALVFFSNTDSVSLVDIWMRHLLNQ
jgi:hypothetical protein